MRSAAERVLQVIDDPTSVSDLQEYFEQGSRGRPPSYSGARFESLGGGGDAPEHCDRITPFDLLALECLSVRVPISVGLDLVEGDLGRQIGDLLNEIPLDVDLGADGAREHVLPGSPADQAWWMLKEQTDVGWVTAGKLLARKRPRLVPVWDQVVRCVYRPPRRENEWVWLNALLREDNGLLADHVEAHRNSAGLQVRVSILRTLDVILWMRHHAEHRPSRCSGI
jgi:hypothetical protein